MVNTVTYKCKGSTEWITTKFTENYEKFSTYDQARSFQKIIQKNGGIAGIN